MVDSHLHLDDSAFDGAREDIIARLAQERVEFVVNNSCDLSSMRMGAELAKHDRVFATVGMHPHDAKSYDEGFEKEMIALSHNPKIVAVGEIGLDYHYDLSDRKTQRDVFARQIEIADKLKLPLTLHVREAYGDAQDILQAQKRYLNSGVLWHCYGGSAEFARQFAKQGHYFAFGGAITFKNAKKEETVLAIPKQQILSETDSPYMAPVPLRGTVNTPFNVRYVLQKLAEIWEVTFEDAENITTENCKRFFPKIAAFAKHR
ncbi:MAG TPA: TatD family hydrolase [Candidatus Fimimonas merdipullorum]|uniref:TatD family hydrolase n=1 Tax=Candidatus Fimimonas merdipullorum TaxID=2840822 RepID=A0A9D1SQP0_9BACT|nr:TatD family hydrolase [Candidatus Fimimonas merdipullorum]